MSLDGRFCWFNSCKRREALKAELAGWEGTRFKRCAGANAVRGVAADCVSGVERVLVNIGAIEPVKWPSYVVRGEGNEMTAVLVGVLATVVGLQRMATLLPGDALPDIMMGDLLLCVSSAGNPHLALFEGDNTIWHVVEKRNGVHHANVFSPIIMQSIRAVYRIMSEISVLKTQS